MSIAAIVLLGAFPALTIQHSFASCARTLNHSLRSLRSSCWHWTVTHYQYEGEKRRRQYLWITDREKWKYKRGEGWSRGTVRVKRTIFSFSISFSFLHVYVCGCVHVWIIRKWMCVCVSPFSVKRTRPYNIPVSHQPLPCSAQHHWVISPTYATISLCYIKNHQILQVTLTNHLLFPLIAMNPSFTCTICVSHW